MTRTVKTVLFLAFAFLLGAKTLQPVNAFIKGSFDEIQNNHSHQAHIIMFWGQDCAYCMKELAMMGELMPQYPNVGLITVSTDPFLDHQIVRNKLAEFKLEQTESWVFASDIPETLYFDVDKRWRGELPLTFFIDKQGNINKKSGLISRPDMQAWLASH